MDSSDLASKVFQTAPKPAGSFGVIFSITPFRQAPSNPPPETATCHSRRRRSRCPTFFNHQQHVPQARKGSERKPPSKPSDAGDRGHSKPVYLLPSSVRKRDSGTCAGRGITDVRTPAQSRTASLPHPVRWDMPPVLMSIPGIESRKGCRVCRINEPAPPGHSCRLKQKKEKKCRSSMSCPVRVIVA